VSTNPPANLIVAAYRGSALSGLTELAADNEYPQPTNDLEGPVLK
jgi:hypothetical protein